MSRNIEIPLVGALLKIQQWRDPQRFFLLIKFALPARLLMKLAVLSATAFTVVSMMTKESATLMKHQPRIVSILHSWHLTIPSPRTQVGDTQRANFGPTHKGF